MKISEREAEILRLMLSGISSTKEIADTMGTSYNTVRTQLRLLQAKVGCNKMLDLALWAERNGYSKARAASA